MTIPHNPFTLVYDRLWTLLEAETTLATMIKPGNRLKFNSETNRNPLKESIASADMPEMLILAPGCDVNLFNSSTSSLFDMDYSIVVNTGDFRLTAIALQISWLVYCQAVKWRSELTSLQWCGDSFVKNVQFNNVSVGESIAERNRGINGFTEVLKVQVQMYLKTSNIVPIEPE